MGLLVKHSALILLISCYQDYRTVTWGKGDWLNVCVFQVSLWEKSSWDDYYYYYLHTGKDSTCFIGLFASIKWNNVCKVFSTGSHIKEALRTWQPLLLKVKLKTHLWLELMAAELPATTKLKCRISVISHVQDICSNSPGYCQLVESVSSWCQSALPWLLCLLVHWTGLRW